MKTCLIGGADTARKNGPESRRFDVLDIGANGCFSKVCGHFAGLATRWFHACTRYWRVHGTADCESRPEAQPRNRIPWGNFRAYAAARSVVGASLQRNNPSRIVLADGHMDVRFIGHYI
ncbi:hypothetical protein [Mesorhizobium australafricanum]|uniref:Uncharacterized protein n=1 Tax=Mesorhizobium australafricanum TaxID=3072311 RepID=A0ABU4WSS5_9HYPH|nr:hypothetical protein [Mesorhizobium sp. VK3E]MDX8439108.1 hypothetical protein [Mesorhizobium sp. VK3E]